MAPVVACGALVPKYHKLGQKKYHRRESCEHWEGRAASARLLLASAVDLSNYITTPMQFVLFWPGQRE